MPDNTQRGDAQAPSPGRSSASRNDATIDVNQAQDLRLWTRKLGVSAQSLRDAVRVAGTNAEAVQRHLQVLEGDLDRRH